MNQQKTQSYIIEPIQSVVFKWNCSAKGIATFAKLNLYRVLYLNSIIVVMFFLMLNSLNLYRVLYLNDFEEQNLGDKSDTLNLYRVLYLNSFDRLPKPPISFN